MSTPSSQAAFPGPNGKIAFEKADDIYIVEPDGSGLKNLTNTIAATEVAPAWSSDGQAIAFVSNVNGFGNLYVMRADGNEIRQVTNLRNTGCPRDPAWAPNGQKLVFTCSTASDADDIFAINSDGTGLTNLTNSGCCFTNNSQPAWSPDGQKIAFVRNYNIYVMNADGTGAVQLTNGGVSSASSAPNWSPDGQKLVFSRGGALWTMSTDGSGATQLTGSPSTTDLDPAWSPDGQKITFARCDPSANFCHADLYVMNADGSSQHLLANAEGGADPSEPRPSPSPDWQPVGPPPPQEPDLPAKIAFVTNRANGDANGGIYQEIWSMNPDGTRLRRITFNNHDGDPAWSPDATRIGFSRGYQDAAEIWVMNADGTSPTQVTNTAGGAFQPVWSPDATRIAFTSYPVNGGNTAPIYLVNPDGTNQTQLTYPPPGAQDYFASWSPDGTKIAFSGFRTGDQSHNIYTIDVDGTGLTNLTHDPRPDFDVDWSPDGRKLAFTYSPADNVVGQIWSMNADGSGRTQLSNEANGAVHPTWSPDGTRIAYSTRRDLLGDEVIVMDSDGSDATDVSNDAIANETSPDWQPLTGYARPKGATPFRAALTIAYKPCTTPNREHGPPLVTGSCNPPQMASNYLTVGTGDANGMLPRSEGGVRYDVVIDKPATPADESDVKLELDMSDVFTKSLADYAGELRASVAVQATDRNNIPYPGGRGPATLPEFPLDFTASCAPTADTTVGSVCSAMTSANAVVPGLVKGGYRTLWELRQVKVFDGGSDSDGATTADNTLFADEGVFAP